MQGVKCSVPHQTPNLDLQPTNHIDGALARVVSPLQDLQSQQAKGNLLARRRFQRGSITLRGDKWVAQWREDEIRPGADKPHRVRRKRVIGSKKDFATKRLAQRELERILAEVNNPTYRAAIAITFAEFSSSGRSASCLR